MDGSSTWNFFEDILPPEVTTAIFSFLELEDVVIVSLVCKSWSTYFDTKDIWKHIYEKNFDETTVDLNQNLRWKRLYLQARRLELKWKKDFSAPHQTFRCTFDDYNIKDQIIFSDRYHVIPTSALVVVDLRLAAKMVPVKHNPVTLHHPGQTDLTTINLAGFVDVKPPKDDIQYVPRYYGLNSDFVKANGQGDFMFKDFINYKYGILRAQNIGADGKMNNSPMLTLYPAGGCETLELSWAFNSKFAAYIDSTGWNDVVIMDLSKRCSHCCTATLKDGNYSLETLATPCQERAPLCAKFERLSGPFVALFASQVNPNLLVFFKEDKIVIWRHEEQSVEIELPSAKKFTNFSEHFVESQGQKRHWFRFMSIDVNDVSRKKIMDLNDLNYQLAPIPGGATKYLWVPKNNKLLCTFNNLVNVVDLEQKRKVVKFEEKNAAGIQAMTFSKSGAILFLATANHVHAYQWETARLISSFAHDNRDVNSIHFALDQVLIIGSRTRVDYKKIMTKLEF